MLVIADGNANEKFENLIELVNNSEISSIKTVVSGLIKIINDPDSNVKDLKEIIQIDPPLTAKLLKLVNSAFYSLQNRISEIDQAVILIGFNALKELALSQKVYEIFAGNESLEEYSRKSLWKHSIAVAIFAKMIYRREFRKRGENAYVAGLLHDIGIIVEDQFYHDDFKHILIKAKNEKINLSEVEYNVFNFDHSEIGMAIADDWNLPGELVMGIGYHHYPDKVSPEYSKLVSTLFLANCFCQESGMGFGHMPCKDNACFQKCLKDLDLQPIALDLIVEDVKQEISKMESQGLL